ncbi:hypothetical protein DFJ63DRAFT_154131 [Scheffersomyces coipomensis]|uniref:uncharacterized protein n=1 Tax=Scheffersomyces coipomensis TaxID=1788519 RepID=UPI00315D68D4
MANSNSPSDDTDSHHNHNHNHANHIKKKRVGKACDSCRIKKTKCDGKKPCNRCLIDNKICVFTEKKKLREKNHPQGYVELLETRLDILTKSLEKLIEISKPHVKILSDLIDQYDDEDNEHDENNNDNDDDFDTDENDEVDIKEEHNHTDLDSKSTDSIIPINRVVTFLINNQGLLNNLPTEWEEGSLIAANLTSKNLIKSSQLFENHKLSNLSSSDFNPVNNNRPILGSSHDSKNHQISNLGEPVNKKVKQEKNTNSKNFLFHDDDEFEDEEDAFIDEDDEYDDISSKVTTSPQNSQTSITDQLNLRDFSLGGFSQNSQIQVHHPSQIGNNNSNHHHHHQHHHSHSGIPNEVDNESMVSPISSRKNSHKSYHKRPSPQSQYGQSFDNSNNNSSSFAKATLFSSPGNATSTSSLPLLTKDSSMISTEDISAITNSPPTSISNGHQQQSQQGIAPLNRRSSSSSINRPFSPGHHQKLRNSGHVHKPYHNGNANGSTSSTSSSNQKINNFINNNGNEFHLQNFSNPSTTATSLNSLFDFNNASSVNGGNFKQAAGVMNQYDNTIIPAQSNENSNTSLFFNDFINQQQAQQQQVQQLNGYHSTSHQQQIYEEPSIFAFNNFQSIDLIVNDNGQEHSTN